MKKFSVIVSIIVFGLVFVTDAYANDRYRDGGYYEAVLKIGPVNGKAGLFFGAKGAWLINHSISLGGGKYWLSEIKTDKISSNGKTLYLDMSYGGFEFGYVYKYKKRVHWTFHTMFGGGQIRLSEHNPTYEIESDGYYVIEPGVSMDVIVTRWFHIGLGFSYFFALGVDLEEFTSSDISGPGFMINLKFGWF